MLNNDGYTSGAMANLREDKERLASGLAWLLTALAIVALLGLFIGIILLGPILLTEQGKASNDAYLKAITDNRTALIQAAGGFGVFLGVVVGIFTLRHNRQQLRYGRAEFETSLQASRREHEESLQASRDGLDKTLAFNRESLLRTVEVSERGQITDRFSKSIEQLGQNAKDSADLRLGGIYALEQIAKDSGDWQLPVVEVLAAFVRQHVTGLPMPDGATFDDQKRALYSLPRDQAFVSLPVDIAAAIAVLGRRDRHREHPARRVDFHGADFRRVAFPVHVEMMDTHFGNAQMQFCLLGFADLRESFFLSTDMRGAVLFSVNLSGADFYRANLEGVDFEKANLAGTEFAHVDLSGVVNLTVDQLKFAKLGQETILPDYIDTSALASETQNEKPAP
jgi:hypothetical protein